MKLWRSCSRGPRSVSWTTAHLLTWTRTGTRGAKRGSAGGTRGAVTLADLAEVRAFRTADGNPYPRLPDIAVDERDRSFVYNATVPVIYGHYWRQNTPVHLEDWTDYTACVDFSAGKDGTLVAYRWDNQPTITFENYVPHGADVVAPAPAR